MCLNLPEIQKVQGCEDLTHWIKRLKAKEAILKSNQNRDLRREVLLVHASQRAQEQLELAQRLNRQRWAQIKAKELEKCAQCLAFRRFCSCNNSMPNASEESKVFDDFFNSMSLVGKKRKPNILRNTNEFSPCKRAKA